MKRFLFFLICIILFVICADRKPWNMARLQSIFHKSSAVVDFTPGTCIVQKEKEDWEPKDIQLILEVGKAKYLYTWASSNICYINDFSKDFLNRTYEITGCPEILNECFKLYQARKEKQNVR
jgi:hypothetical protein